MHRDDEKHRISYSPIKKPNESWPTEIFKRLIKRLSKTDEQAEELFDAKVAKESAEAEFLIAQANELAAKRVALEQKNLDTFCDLIDKHFHGLEDTEAQKIKLSRLLNQYPEIGAQMEKVEGIIDKLRADKGASLEFIDEP